MPYRFQNVVGMNIKNRPSQFPNQKKRYASSELGAIKRPAKVKVAKPKSPPKIKVTKAKSPTRLKADNLATSSTLFRVNNGRGTVADTGVRYPGSGFISIFAPPPPPKVSVVSSTAKPSKLDSLFGLASQVISGWSKNPTIQTADGQVPLYQVPQQQQQPYQQPYQEYAADDPNYNGGAGANVGASLGGGFDGMIRWGSANPGIVIAVVVGGILLFKQPPGSNKR